MNWNFDDVEKSNDSHNSPWWKCRRIKRPQFVKELEICLTMKVVEDTSEVLSLGKLCDEHG